MSYNLSQVRAAVQNLLRDDPSLPLAQVSERLKVERHTIERAFRLAGTTFRRFREDVAVQLAVDLLTGQGGRPLSVKEVSSRLGYTSSAFTRMIRRRLGTTPSAVRETERMGGLRRAMLEADNRSARSDKSN